MAVWGRRIGQISRQLVAANIPQSEHASDATESTKQQHTIPRDEERERLRGRLKTEPRISKDLNTWTEVELMHRSLALHADEAAVNAALASDQTKAQLIALVESLEPPAPHVVTVEQITCDPRTQSFEEMAAVLEEIGVLVILNAVDEATIAEVDKQLESAGAWAISRGKKGRMQMDMLLKAPATRKLLTNKYVLGVTRSVLGKSCKRIALKELSVFEVQPGQEEQKFHR
eukprot:SAG31_NODE_2386_length_5814_cov_3.981627_2_plen_230_part_00